MLKRAGFTYHKLFNNRIASHAFGGGRLSPVLQLCRSHTSLVTCPGPRVAQLLRLQRRLPQLVVIGGSGVRGRHRWVGGSGGRHRWVGGSGGGLAGARRAARGPARAHQALRGPASSGRASFAGETVVSRVVRRSAVPG